MARATTYRRVRNSLNKSFERRRCPACLRGLFSKSVNIPATHRKCDSCGHVFHLEREGVRPIADAQAAQTKTIAPSSSGPIAGGEFAIAGTVKIGRGMSRWGSGY